MSDLRLSPAAFWERVYRAREMDPGEKLIAGIRMFDEECEQRRTEIRKEFPELSDEEVQAELRRQLKAEREAEEDASPLMSARLT